MCRLVVSICKFDLESKSLVYKLVFGQYKGTDTDKNKIFLIVL